MKELSIETFFNENYVDFATYSAYRSISSIIDGLKNSQRKVIWTVQKNNINQNMKVSTLSSKTIEQTEYLHGDASMQELVTNLAKNYSGSNNFNLLAPEGHFGYRTNTKAAASRYIYTKKINDFDNVFIKSDNAILEHQIFEGTKIEPKYLTPIIPLILINGSIGIGTGFSQKIFPRSKKRIIEILKNLLKHNRGFREITPSLNDYKGNIYRAEEKDKLKVFFEGSFKRKNTTTIIIEEIPPQYDLQGYIKVLENLVLNKKIKSYIDSSNENNFSFELKVERTFTKLSDEQILKTLDLVKTDIENFTVVSETNQILTFSNEKELMLYYIDFRKKLYKKRKEWMLFQLEEEKILLNEKWRFIDLVLKEIILVSNQTKLNLENQIIKNKFIKINDSYDYLIKMPIYALTKDEYEKLKEDFEKLKKSIDLLAKKSIEELWLEDLENLN